jgi:SRSO17 transposase
VGQVPDTDAGQVKGWAGELDAPTRPGSARRGVKSVGVFPAYASSRGHALVDRELYLPRRWTDDLALCAEAGVPDQFPFRTKPQLTQAMLERAVTAGVTAGWVTGDTI